MAFSVISTMDGSNLGSLSTSKRRSPGSNRAGGRKQVVIVHFDAKIMNVSSLGDLSCA